MKEGIFYFIDIGWMSLFGVIKDWRNYIEYLKKFYFQPTRSSIIVCGWC